MIIDNTSVFIIHAQHLDTKSPDMEMTEMVLTNDVNFAIQW